ncbi:hypothetical protein TNCT_28961 [Trichonephila clavata]|uniref:Uncharacterized protein n=1 Tax=Trichonephila clavata TaxID=2740835 RepID=A0A8X6J0I7_TRICU|nr:hypothetical protein TNCT_28961 [Trichonephila clavata]
MGTISRIFKATKITLKGLKYKRLPEKQPNPHSELTKQKPISLSLSSVREYKFYDISEFQISFIRHCEELSYDMRPSFYTAGRKELVLRRDLDALYE